MLNTSTKFGEKLQMQQKKRSLKSSTIEYYQNIYSVKT